MCLYSRSLLLLRSLFLRNTRLFCRLRCRLFLLQSSVFRPPFPQQQLVSLLYVLPSLALRDLQRKLRLLPGQWERYLYSEQQMKALGSLRLTKSEVVRLCLWLLWRSEQQEIKQQRLASKKTVILELEERGEGIKRIVMIFRVIIFFFLAAKSM
ncbi:hypothetical protein F5146DRAFT_159953 [Armillaria mellea]|nr:hypothetical protein F5146DRAFT_159953 [Armillaria mellea]